MCAVELSLRIGRRLFRDLVDLRGDLARRRWLNCRRQQSIPGGRRAQQDQSHADEHRKVDRHPGEMKIHRRGLDVHRKVKRDACRDKE